MTIISFQKRKIRAFRRRVPRHRYGMKAKSYIPRRIYTVSKGKGSLYKLRTPRISIFKWKLPDPTQYARSFNIFSNLPKKRIFYTTFKPKGRAYKASVSMSRSKKSSGKTKSFSGKTKSFGDMKMYKVRKDVWKKQVEKWQKEIKIPPKPTKLFPTHGSGYSNRFAFKWGRDPWGGDRAKWRAYKRTYGPAGAFGPSLVIDIRPRRKALSEFIKRFAKSGKTKIGHTMIINDIQKMLEKLKLEIMTNARKYIGQYVPKDTGALRNTMLSSLGNAQVRGLILRMLLDTGKLEYAKPVNNMPSSMLRHSAFDVKIRKMSRGWYDSKGIFTRNTEKHPKFNLLGYKNRPPEHITKPSLTNIYKHDPKAVKGWWGFSLMSARKYARDAYNEFITNMATYFSVRVWKNSGIPIPKTEYLNVNKLRMGMDMVKQLQNYRIMNIEWTWEDEIEHYRKIYDFVEPTPKKWVGDHFEPKTKSHMKRNRRSTLRNHPGILYHYPHYKRQLDEGLDASWIEKARDNARVKQQEATTMKQDIIDEEDRIRIIKRAALRGKFSAKEVKEVIRPSRLDIKKLFTVNFK